MHLKIPKGAIRDIPFRLRESEGGALIDDVDWVDGLQSTDEWPRVRVLDDTDTQVTAQVVRDITGDTIEPFDEGYPAAQKHIDPATGIVRDSKGEYRVFLEPQVAEGNYTLEVTFDSPGGTVPDTHLLTVMAPGTVDFLEGTMGILPEHITAGIHTSLSTETIDALILEAINEVFGIIEMCSGIDPDTWTELPRIIRTIIILRVRGVLFNRDVSAGERPISVKEGTVTYRFGGDRSNDELAETFLGRADRLLDKWCGRYGSSGAPMINVTRIRQHTSKRLTERGEW